MVSADFYNPDGTFVATNVSAVRSGTRKTIVDVYKPYGNGVWKMFQPCHITETSDLWRPAEVNMQLAKGDYPRYSGCDGFVQNNGRSSGSRFPVLPDIPLVALEEIPASAWTKLDKKVQDALPSLKGELPDMAVWLSELADISSLATFLTQKWEKTIRALTGKAAESRLIDKLVVGPGIGDAKSIGSRITLVMEQLEHLYKGAGKVHTLRCTVKPPPKQESVGRGWCFSYFDSSYEGCGQLETKSEVSFSLTAVMKFSYTMADSFKVAQESWAYVMAALGLLPTIGSVWEKIPYSFVIDWFVNTDRFLRHLKTGADSLIDIQIHDTCIVIRRESRVQQVLRAPCMVGSCGRTVKIKEMKRVVGDLESFLPIFHFPSLSQLLTGLALGTTVGLRLTDGIPDL
jgi:hypothetical protein